MSKAKINPYDNVLALCYLAAIITAIIVGFATEWSAWFLVCIMFCPALFRLVALCVSKRYRTWCEEQEEQERAELRALNENFLELHGKEVERDFNKEFKKYMRDLENPPDSPTGWIPFDNSSSFF